MAQQEDSQDAEYLRASGSETVEEIQKYDRASCIHGRAQGIHTERLDCSAVPSVVSHKARDAI